MYTYDLSLSATPNCDIAVSTSTDKPRLLMTPFQLQYAQALFHFVTAENLQRNDQRVRHEIVIDSRMEYLDSSVIRG